MQTALPPAPEEATAAIDSVHLALSPSEIRPSGVGLRHGQQSAVPLVHLRIVLPVGWSSDGSRPGVSALTAYSLVEGMIGSDAAIGRVHGIEEIAETGIEVLSNSTIFSAEILSHDVEEAVDSLREMMRAPSFRTLAFQRAQTRVLQGIGDTQREMRMQAALADLSIPTVEQWERSVKAMESWQCRAFYQSYYRAEGAVVVWVGDIGLERARNLTDRLFEGWKPSKTVATPRVAAAATPKAPVVEPLVGKANLVLLASGPPLADNDWPALWLIAMAMESECDVLPWHADSTAFRICKQISVLQRQQEEAALRKRLDEIIADGLSLSEMESAKRKIVEMEARRMSDPKAIANMLSRWDASQADGVGDRLRAVTDIRSAARRFLDAKSVKGVLVPMEPQKSNTMN